MKLRIRNIASTLLLLLLPLTESRSLQVRPGQWSVPPQGPQRLGFSVQNVFDYSYGDQNYDYDGQLSRNGRGYLTPSHKKVASEAESDEDDDDQRWQIKGSLRADRSPHVVVDDVRNFDYTYGDPEVDYDFDVDTSNENGDDKDDENDGEDSSEVWSPGDNNSNDSGGGDHKRVTRIVTSIVEWLIRNWEKAKVIKEHWKETKADIQMRWKRIKHNMKRIKNSLQGIFSKFGREIQEGLKYCLVKIKVDDETIEIEASEALQKLERLLNAGSKIVAAFFELLGQKASDISSPYINEAEDIGVEGRTPTRNNMELDKYSLAGTVKENGDQSTSSTINLFEDPEVLQKLNLLVEENLISREEADAILKAATEQTERSGGSSYHRRDLIL